MTLDDKHHEPGEAAKSGALHTVYRMIASLVGFAIRQPVFVGGLLIAPILIPQAMKSAIIIDSIDVPTVISDDGFSSEIMARRIKDQMREVFAIGMPAYQKLGLEEQAIDEKIPDIDLTQSAISIRTAVSLGRDFLGLKDNKITGELVVALAPPTKPPQKTKEKDEEEKDEDQPKNYILLLRSTTNGQIGSIATRFPHEKFMDVFRQAAVAIIENTNPYVAARYYERTSQIDQARRIAAKFLKSSNKADHIQAYYIIATTYVKIHEYDKAADNYNKILAIDPNYALALSGLSFARNWAGRFKESIEYADRALAINPKNGGSYSYKAYALTNLNRAEEALAVAKLGATKAVSNIGQPVAAEAAAYLRLGRLEEALAAANKAVALSPTLHTGHRMQGVANLRLGNLDDAIDSFRKAIEYEPAYGGNWSLLSDALMKKGLTQEAVEAIQTGRDRQSGLVEHWIKLGERMILAGQSVKAIPDMQEGLKRFTRNPALTGLLAEAYLNTKATQKAHGLLVEFETSRDLNIVKRLLMVAKAKKDHPKILVYATRLTEIEPKNPQHFYEKYLVLRADKKRTEARLALNAAIEAGHPNKDQLVKDLAALDKAKT